MKPELIHKASKSVNRIGGFFWAIGLLALIGGVIWAFVSLIDDPSGGFFLAISGLLVMLSGSLISHMSLIVRAAETYLYNEDDHTIGSRDDIINAGANAEQRKKEEQERIKAAEEILKK